MIGLFFTAAGIRTTFAVAALRNQRRPQLYLIVLLLVAFGFELAAGIALLVKPQTSWALTTVANVLVASLFMGIARAWELVGDWDTGIVTSIAVLVGHKTITKASAEQGSPEVPEFGTRDDPGSSVA